MRYTIVIAAIISLAQAAAPLIAATTGETIPGAYIVVLKEGQTTAAFAPKFTNIARRQNNRGGRQPAISRTYESFPAFAASLNDAALKEILASDEVAYVEQDAIVHALGTQPSPPSWGLTRISQVVRDLTQPYFFNDAAGIGTNVYVLDTGIMTTHADFGGRAVHGANFIPGSPITDENGHGTGVAAVIGGHTYGVAKKTKLISVKILNSSGAGTISGIIQGMDWVIMNHVPNKSVVNMSVGGGQSQAVSDAAQRMYLKNIPLFVAAGNSANACNTSPASAPTAFAVGASNSKDQVATISGACIKCFAPGAQIKTAWIGSPSASITVSGNSFAVGHVSGAAVLYMSFNTLPTVQSVYNKIVTTATLNLLTGTFNGAPNRLLFNGGP
ncbi:hypothetical protein BG004_001444 [Podila humilis]|nr:hypothetical protein BG004_001444 [Podila humilis]